MRTLRCLMFRYTLGQARRAAHLRTALFHSRRRDEAGAACRVEIRTRVCCHIEMTDHLRLAQRRIRHNVRPIAAVRPRRLGEQVR